mgnify:CR=1 FL=1
MRGVQRAGPGGHAFFAAAGADGLGHASRQPQGFIAAPSARRGAGQQQQHGVVLGRQPAQRLVFTIGRLEQAAGAIQIAQAPATPGIKRRELDDLGKRARPVGTIAGSHQELADGLTHRGIGPRIAAQAVDQTPRFIFLARLFQQGQQL